MAKQHTHSGKRPSREEIVAHLKARHMQFDFETLADGSVGIGIKVSVRGKGESPCPYCMVEYVSICPKYPC